MNFFFLLLLVTPCLVSQLIKAHTPYTPTAKIEIRQLISNANNHTGFHIIRKNIENVKGSENIESKQNKY